MMKHEFCERAKINEADLNDEDYGVIEFVYTYGSIRYDSFGEIEEEDEEDEGE